MVDLLNTLRRFRIVKDEHEGHTAGHTLALIPKEALRQGLFPAEDKTIHQGHLL